MKRLVTRIADVVSTGAVSYGPSDTCTLDDLFGGVILNKISWFAIKIIYQLYAKKKVFFII